MVHFKGLERFASWKTVATQFFVNCSVGITALLCSFGSAPPGITPAKPLSLATDSGYVFFIIRYLKKPYLDPEKILSSG